MLVSAGALHSGQFVGKERTSSAPTGSPSSSSASFCEMEWKEKNACESKSFFVQGREGERKEVRSLSLIDNSGHGRSGGRELFFLRAKIRQRKDMQAIQQKMAGKIVPVNLKTLANSRPVKWGFSPPFVQRGREQRGGHNEQ